MNEPTILVTGATDGIGRGTAIELARRGARVLLHGRDGARLAATRDEIAAETGGVRPDTYLADFASLAEVRRLAAEVSAAHPVIDVLINNAGIGRGPRRGHVREVGADGHELRFQVNHLAPFLLSLLLLDNLRRAKPGRILPGRIVNVSSAGQMAIDFDDVMIERGYDGGRAYCQSKLAMVMATFELARRVDADEVTVNALHPGSLLDTKMVREGFGTPLGPVETGIDSEVYLATSADLEGVTGAYFDRRRRARADDQAYDDHACRALWDLSERLTGA